MFEPTHLEKWAEELKQMPLHKLVLFYNGLLNLCAMTSIAFEQRFPEDYERFNRKLEEEDE